MSKRILILNSYTLTQRPAGDQARVCSFLAGLTEGGYRVDYNLDVEVIDSNDLAQLEDQLVRALGNSPDLIHAVGTPNAILAVRLAGSIPIVYYGAHPEGVGVPECSAENLRGVRLTLPFTSNYKSYRFIRKLLPTVRRVYVPFYEHTVFCPESMRQKHNRFRERTASSPWIPMDSEFIGYRSLAGLNYIVGLDYRELVYHDAEDLEAALGMVDPCQAMLMPYNDSVYCCDAPRLLIRFAIEAGIPLIWNNNPEATHIGALAAISGCFEEAGRICGLQAAHILDTGSLAGIESRTSTRSWSSLNLRRAVELRLNFSDLVLSYFDELIQVAGSAPAQGG
ncbi:MAG: hypothetical protein ABSH52_15325 [Terriglobia bacterium]|jgi:ABC-type uncharacterized transport system substrate-binding protein